MAKKAAKSKKAGTNKGGRKVKPVEDIKRDISSKCLSIRTIISTGALGKLSELEPLFSKAMADELGVNHGRFQAKLRNPVKLTMTEIHRFANYTQTDVEKLTRIVNAEIMKNKAIMTILTKFRSVEKMPQYTKSQKTARS